jgi:tRNA dimethylallyltransferase
LSKSKKTLITIVGPTAIGKTALAIEIAKQYQTDIISADSRQFFKEISIGTAKPTEEELRQVKHHFINSYSVTDEISVGSYEKEAIATIENLFLTHDVVVMVGGSGLYINAVLYGFDDIPDADTELRDQLNQQFQEKGISNLQEMLKVLDPVYYAQVDIHNQQRIIRGLEVCISTGKPFTSFRNSEQKQRSFDHIIIGLNTDREKLYAKINQRVDLMVKNGLVDEVTSLTAYKSLNALKTVGYSEIFNFLEGNSTLETAIEKIKLNTRHFAKRQVTWFKKYHQIFWFEPNEVETIKTKVAEFVDELSLKKS